MRLGGPIFRPYADAQEWIDLVKAAGYRAAYCPVNGDAGEDVVKAFAAAAEKADIVIAEVGTWSNPLSPNEAERLEALEKCKKGLDLADRIGANCCVNIAGSRGDKWDGPCPSDLTAETFDRIVETVRDILDSVQPKRSFYTLETMPWMFPDSADSYLELIRAIDRRSFAVHFDPVNLVCSPQRYFANRALIRDFVDKLGAKIKSVHAKDIILRDRLTVHLDEVLPGTGGLDYRTLLQCLNSLPQDVPVLLEHLPGEAEYIQAANYIRSTAGEIGIPL